MSASAPDPSLLQQQVKKGTFWSLLSTILLRIGQFGVGVLVARIVSPEEFGLMSVALIVHAIIISANDLGVTAAIMRDQGDVRDKLPTVNVIAVTFAAVATLAMFFSAGLVATLLGAPEAKSAVQILSLTIALGGVSAVPTALLFREFRQKERFVSDTFNLLSSSVVVLLLVSMGWGADGIAWSRVVGQLVGTAIYMAFAHYVIRLGWHREYASELLRFGVPLAGSNIIAFTVENVDYMVVARMRGPVQLGYYTLAYNIAGWPAALTNSVLNTIVIPAAARLAGLRANLRRELVRGFGLVALVTAPASALIAALSAPLTSVLYGAKWLPAATAMAVLALFGPYRIATTGLADVLIALGRTRRLFWIRLLWLVCLLPALILGVARFGIVGAAFAQILVTALVVLPAMLIPLRSEGAIDIRGFGRVLAPMALGAALTAVTAYVAGHAFASPLANLLCGGVVGALTYTAVLLPGYLRYRRKRTGWWSALMPQPAPSDE